MSAYSRKSPDRGDRRYERLADWETAVADAVGRVIEFWGFKRNHGRVWAVLYLRRSAMSSRDLQKSLELSKGAVSMITRDLIQWGVVRRERVSGSQAQHFVAESDFLSMIRKVLRQRELPMIERVKTDLADAALDARDDDAPEEVVERIRRMERLADLAKNALELFLSSARLDVTDAEGVL